MSFKKKKISKQFPGEETIGRAAISAERAIPTNLIPTVAPSENSDPIEDHGNSNL